MVDLSVEIPADALADTVVVITGASRGLGAGLAARFAEHGATLGLCARTEPVSPAGVAIVRQRVDVTRSDEVDAFADEVFDTLGPVDLWINNAGILGPVGPLRDLDAEGIEAAFGVNVLGVANGTRSFAARAREASDRPRMLANISSGAGRSSYQGWSVYGATKAAVDRLTQIVDQEEPGIRCFAVAPGVVETDMQVAVRRAEVADFPSVDRFRRIHAEGRANSPAWVADHLTAILLGTLSPDDVLYRVPDEHP